MRESRSVVFFINPPNSNDLGVIRSDSQYVSKGVQHTDWANFPHLGILSLASYVDSLPGMESIYIDGVVYELDSITAVIRQQAYRTLAVCLSTITANYEAAIILARAVKAIDSNISIIIGNDHFSAMSEKILTRYRDLIDCGFIGNEIYTGLGEYLKDLQGGHNDRIYPGCIRWHNDKLLVDPQIRESVNRIIDYRLIDRALPHTQLYATNFTRRLGSRIHQLTGRYVRQGVPVEIGRGCIKFSGDDACSFCSIQYGGMWKNELPATHAWQVIHQAWSAGYDYLYVTADELPLTFARLLLDMAASPPKWWSDLEPSERPVLVGYARADGMEKEAVLKAMRQIGFRILFVGVDAGAELSLLALNKPLKNKSPALAAKRMYESNLRALENARKHHVSIKAGFVLGHLGMNESLLAKNVQMYIEFLRNGKDVIVSADIELLSPEPGSKDFNYLINPDLAEAFSNQIGLAIAPIDLRNEVASEYACVDIFDREKAIEDYIKVFMPTISKDQLAGARDRVRAECTKLGIVVGEEI
ncbi:B12-binding domain-containing radical SAM protein [Chitinimonas sp. PSY-7]|uniref:B12-binding domain-containing radical SAM protein n=1 Tax=Chitinimonas sp. PSY-7 TaxID=3459088 RepID=UPI00403FF1AF